VLQLHKERSSCVAVRSSVLQVVTVCCIFPSTKGTAPVLQCVVLCCNELYCVVGRCSVLQFHKERSSCVAMRSSVLQVVEVCCSSLSTKGTAPVLQCVLWCVILRCCVI